MLRSKHPEIVFSISCTTRAPRPGDEEGVTYYFLSKEKFEEGIHNGDFLEWAKVHDNYYGTPKAFVQASLDSGRSVIMDLDVQGAEQVKKKLGEKAVTVFILPPNEDEWIRRLRGRGTDSEESIQKRIRNGKEELERRHEFDHILVNDTLDRTLQGLEAILF